MTKTGNENLLDLACSAATMDNLICPTSSKYLERMFSVVVTIIPGLSTHVKLSRVPHGNHCPTLDRKKIQTTHKKMTASIIHADFLASAVCSVL